MKKQIEVPVEAKLRFLNLLQISPTMRQFLFEMFPDEVLVIEKTEFDYQYVRFHYGKPYFFTEKYIQETPLDELLKRGAEHMLEVEADGCC